MLRRDKILVFLFLLLPEILSAQSITTIKISGNNNFSKDDIQNWADVNTGMKIYPGIIDSVKSGIAEHFAEYGYVNANFDGTKLDINTDTTDVTLFIKVNEGEPAVVRKVNISGTDSLFTDKINEIFSFLENQNFNKFNLEEDISSSLTFYENNGYPFAKIIISSIEFQYDTLSEKSTASINLKVDEGTYSKIDKIEIIGNDKTADYVILRELRIDVGEIYSQNLIDELPKRLNRLRFFEPVAKPEFFINSKNKGVLVLRIKEKQTNNFDGIIGYIPGTGNQKGYLTGLVNVSLRNLFGTGRAAAIRWQQYDRFSQDLELKYLEPWLFGYPFNLNASLFQRKQDSSYVQRKLEGSLEYLATESISASVFISTESVIPTDNGNNVFSVFNSTSVTTGINLKIDTRDDPYAPTEGILFMNSYSYSKKKINGPPQFLTPNVQRNVNFQRITLDLSGFYELFSRQIVALGVHGRELRGNNFEVSDLYKLGGANTLRGYTEEQFLGNRIFWSNFEYRLLLQKRTYGFLFFDTGYFLRDAEPDKNIDKQEGFRIGYGLGLNIETNLGVLSVSFALAKGDSFSDGKIHFGIVNEF